MLGVTVKALKKSIKKIVIKFPY